MLNFVNTGAGAGTLSLHEYKYPDKVHRDGFLKYFHKLYLRFHSIGSKNREDRTSTHVFAFISTLWFREAKMAREFQATSNFSSSTR